MFYFRRISQPVCPFPWRPLRQFPVRGRNRVAASICVRVFGQTRVSIPWVHAHRWGCRLCNGCMVNFYILDSFPRWPSHCMSSPAVCESVSCSRSCRRHLVWLVCLILFSPVGSCGTYCAFNFQLPKNQ